MVVVTRRLRTVVAPSQTNYADFPEDPVLQTSYGVAGRPLEDDTQKQKIYQESHPDPTITLFRPFTTPAAQAATHSHIRSDATVTGLTWILALAAGFFLGVLIYLLMQKIPYYPSTALPIPNSGVFTQVAYHLPTSFPNLPSLPRVSANDLNLTPILPFSIR